MGKIQAHEENDLLQWMGSLTSDTE